MKTDICTCMVISRSVLLIMRNVWDKVCWENKSAHFLFNNFFLSSENHAFYEIVWENTVELVRPQMTIWRVRIACWITKATNTHTQYVILIGLAMQIIFTNLPECYVLHTLPVLFVFNYHISPICHNFSVNVWFYNTVTSSCSHTGRCVCVWLVCHFDAYHHHHHHHYHHHHNHLSTHPIVLRQLAVYRSSHFPPVPYRLLRTCTVLSWSSSDRSEPQLCLSLVCSFCDAVTSQTL